MRTFYTLRLVCANFEELISFFRIDICGVLVSNQNFNQQESCEIRTKVTPRCLRTLKTSVPITSLKHETAVNLREVCVSKVFYIPYSNGL
jgi:hypothetical protein